jgi:hypothetical protein
MDAYSGFEPQVGEIRALRSFRIGRGGQLYPLFGDEPWSAGTNTAHCRASGLFSHSQAEHLVVSPDCTCGFYAYGDGDAAAEYPHSNNVLAVVACWGRVVAGTRGLRSQHARIEAIWMSSTVPADLAATVADQYPAVTVYDDRATMLAEHPATQLDCYESPSARDRKAMRIGLRVALVAALVLGLLPWAVLTGNHNVFAGWAVTVCGFVIAAFNYGRRVDVAARKRALLCSATVLWLVAPMAGPAGFLFLRLPVVQLAVLARRHRSSALRAANTFPADIG